MKLTSGIVLPCFVAGLFCIERMCQLAQVSRAGFYRSLQEREPVAEEMEVRSTIQQIALEHAIAQRQSPPGLVHHSDRGVQYASDEYVQVLRQHQMIPSMSRPANPYDNASCESFMKTLKREEIYANHYRDLDHLRANIEAFIDQYYNSRRYTQLSVTNRRRSSSRTSTRQQPPPEPL